MSVQKLENKKKQIFQQKRQLKANPRNIVITEDYRQFLVKKLNVVQNKKQIDSFWNVDGRIFAKKLSINK